VTHSIARLLCVAVQKSSTRQVSLKSPIDARAVSSSCGRMTDRVAGRLKAMPNKNESCESYRAYASASAVGALLLSLLPAACSGSTGPAGPAGATGAAGPAGPAGAGVAALEITTAKTITGTITS